MNKLTEPQREDFQNISQLIQAARTSALASVNKILIELYWAIGKLVSSRIESAGWGKSSVKKLSEYIAGSGAVTKGYSARNIWRMKQFYEAYQGDAKLSTLLTEISWSNHLHILAKTQSLDEKKFYLKLARKDHYPARQFARIIDSCVFERTMIANQKLPEALIDFPADAKNVFKDFYLFEFTGLQHAVDYKELDLKKRLLSNLRSFLLELGPDFTFVGQEYLVQVGNKDYYIDLLLHHRALNCLVCCELKVGEFKPEHLGKLEFYLEALDQTTKKSHENPSIGLLIAKTKDDEVVKFAMNRNMSPALIADYKLELVDKPLLQQRLLEITQSLCLASDEIPDEKESILPTSSQISARKKRLKQV